MKEVSLTSRIAMASHGSYKEEYGRLECSSVVVHLTNVCEVLGSIPSVEKKKTIYKQKRSMAEITLKRVRLIPDIARDFTEEITAEDKRKKKRMRFMHMVR